MNTVTTNSLVSYLNKSKTLTVIVSLTRNCCLKCKYCFAIEPGNKEHAKIIPLDIVEKIIKDAFDTKRKPIIFEWTGGEPLLAGKTFFEKVLEYQAKYKKSGVKYENCIQTSGCVYNEDLYDYLIENNFNISISLDGPPDLHNSNRLLRDGRPSFDYALKSYEYIRKKQGYCGAISTTTRSSIGRTKDIIEFFKSIGLTSWHSNHYIYDPAAPNKNGDYALTPAEFYAHYVEQLNTYLELNDKEQRIGHILYILKALMGISSPTLCIFGGRCLTNYINIDPSGNAALCPKFMGHKDHNLGSVKEHTISWLLSSKNPRMAQYLKQRVECVNRCEKERCEFIPICNYGCPYMSFLKSGSQSIAARDILCGARKTIFKRFDQKLKDYGVKTYVQCMKINERRYV